MRTTLVMLAALAVQSLSFQAIAGGEGNGSFNPVGADGYYSPIPRCPVGLVAVYDYGYRKWVCVPEQQPSSGGE